MKITGKDTQADLRKWAETWDRAGKVLDEIRIKELQSKDYYKKNFLIINSMLAYAFEHSTPITTSGLVEMQKLFKKLKDKF